MNREQMESKIRDVLQKEMEESTDVNSIDINDDLVNYGMNSTIILKMIMNIEKELNITMSDDDFDEENFRSIADIMDMVERIQ